MTTQTTPPLSTPTPPADPTPTRSLIASIGTTASSRWPLTALLLLMVLVAGVLAFTTGLERQGFPPVDTPISIITGTYFVDDAEVVDAEVAAPLEAALARVEGVVSTSSQAQPSGFVIVVEFADGVSSDVGTQRLVDAGVGVPDAATVDYRALDAASFVGEYDLLVSITGRDGVPPEELESQAAGLARALDAEAAVARADVRDLVTESIDPTTGEDVVRLTRFTRVALEGTGYRPAIAVGVVQADGSGLDVLEFSDRVQSIIDADTSVDDGFQAVITADFATGVRAQLGSLSDNLTSGLIAVAIVSLLLIGWRAAVMTAGFMAVVMVGALALLWATGYSLNTITLFGLILTLGLLVDDAIVISESIDANRDDPDPGEVDPGVGIIRTALARVGSASLAGTLTTIVVFSPLLFIGGILGEFIRPIPATVIMTLLTSFVFSITFIPLAARLFLLRGGAGRNPVVRGLQVVAAAGGRLAGYPSGNGLRGYVVGTALAMLALIAVGVGGGLAGGLGFAIFPSGKDSLGLQITAEFPPGTTIEAAQDITARIDEVVVGVVGEDLVRSQYLRGNERVAEIVVDLSPIGSRETTSPQFVQQIEAGVADVAGARVSVAQVENGPPVEEYPFATQISVTEGTVAAGRSLAGDIAADLAGATLDVAGRTVTITDAIISTEGQVARVDGERYIEVRAAYDDVSSVTSALVQTQELVEERVAGSLVERGLPADALAFDFGFESDNQEDFAALGVVGVIAVALMLLLLAVQFRSVAQSLLIFLAIPFSFLGVFSLLTATDNPLSFLVAVGFIALIGVAVNNTILLVEAANRSRAAGAPAGQAIAEAVERRFRPLVATTATTVVGLLPLALSDPFWESLGFTLIGGLVSSTILVLISFPPFYLALEAVRTPLRNAVRRRRGRPPLP